MRSLLFVLAVGLQDPLDGTVHFANDTVVRALFADLLRAGGQGRFDQERAAFIVTEEDGYRCEFWPASRGFRQETFVGRVPPGTIAIAHTHPRGNARPSTGDIDAASASGLPIVVLTPQSIFAATPEGKVVRVVDGPNWVLDTASGHRCAEPPKTPRVRRARSR